MALAALFDDFPVRVYNRRRPLSNMVSFFDNDLNRQIGQVFHQLPAILCGLSDDEYQTNGENRKRRVLSKYEPKSKVMVTTDDKFQVTLDTSNYQPDEIMVKVVDDKLAVSAKHEIKHDNLYEFHEMYRCFDLPEGVDPSTVKSKLSSSGQLTIEAPMVKPKELTSERVIPIEMPKDRASSEDTEKEVHVENS